MAVRAPKTINVCGKVSDLCAIQVYDETGAVIQTHDGYVPDWFPDGGGDYITLEIDVATGKILNWTTPTDADIAKLNGKG